MGSVLSRAILKRSITVSALVLSIGLLSCNIQPGMQQDRGRFDSKDFEQTRQWALSAYQRIHPLQGNNGNQIAYNDEVNSFRTATRQFIRKKVTWSLPVEEVTERSVSVKVTWYDGKKEKTQNGDYFLLLQRRRGEALNLLVGPEITRERAAALRAGNVVRVSGELEEIDFEHGNVLIVLTRLSAE